MALPEHACLADEGHYARCGHQGLAATAQVCVPGSGHRVPGGGGGRTMRRVLARCIVGLIILWSLASLGELLATISD